MTFHASIHAAASSSKSGATKPGPFIDPDPTPRGRVRVVVADDDPDTVLSLTALLEDEGFDTIAVYDGREVLRAVVDSGAQAALIDIGMPGMSGYDVARALRKRYDSGKPLLIAVTAWAKITDRLMAKVAGFDHHVAKPYDPNKLLQLLAPLTDRPPQN